MTPGPRSRTAPGPGRGRRKEQRRGTVALVAAVAMVSIDAVIIRWLDTDPWSVISLRSPATAVGLLLIARVAGKRSIPSQLRAAGWWGLGVTAASMTSSLLWVYALSHTAVANVLTVYAGVPLFVALLGWLVAKERLAAPTWAALVIVTVSVLALVVSGVESGGLGGDLAGLSATLTFALALALMRKARLSSMIPAMAASHVALAIMGFGFGRPGSFSGVELAVTLTYALAVMAPGIALLTYAPRLLPAGEVGLVLPLETVLASGFAWLLLGEAPDGNVWLAAVVIIATLVVHSRWALRRAAADPGFAVPG